MSASWAEADSCVCVFFAPVILTTLSQALKFKLWSSCPAQPAGLRGSTPRSIKTSYACVKEEFDIGPLVCCFLWLQFAIYKLTFTTEPTVVLFYSKKTTKKNSTTFCVPAVVTPPALNSPFKIYGDVQLCVHWKERLWRITCASLGQNLCSSKGRK